MNYRVSRKNGLGVKFLGNLTDFDLCRSHQVTVERVLKIALRSQQGIVCNSWGEVSCISSVYSHTGV